MNRIKKFKMSPETAYRFAIGELQIESKEQLEQKFPEKIRNFLVLNAEEEITKFMRGNWRDLKLKSLLREYYKVMSTNDLVLSIYNKSAYFECSDFLSRASVDDADLSSLFASFKFKYRHIRDLEKQLKIPNILTDEEKEIFIKGPKWAVKYAKFTKERFPKHIEEKLLRGEETNKHAQRTSTTYVLEYCKLFNIILENYNEILLQEGFGEKSKFSASNKAYLKKIQEEKEKCREFVIAIMEKENLSEQDAIQKLIECLT